MTVTFGTPNGPFIIGPGAPIQAHSDLLGLANPPYTWRFQFTDPEGTFSFSQSTVTQEIDQQAQVYVQWTDLDTPAPLLAWIHQKLGGTVAVTVDVTDSNGDRVDGPVTLNPQWEPVVWAQWNQELWANNIVSRVTGIGTNDKIDQILAAVYRRFPNA